MGRAMTETERRDWAQYRATGDVDARNSLVARHLALVHHFAGRMKPRTGGAVDRDDLVSAGVLGLMKAVSREIAGKLGVTESRVSQLRSRALKRLRTQLSDLREVA